MNQETLRDLGREQRCQKHGHPSHVPTGSLQGRHHVEYPPPYHGCYCHLRLLADPG